MVMMGIAHAQPGFEYQQARPIFRICFSARGVSQARLQGKCMAVPCIKQCMHAVPAVRQKPWTAGLWAVLPLTAWRSPDKGRDVGGPVGICFALSDRH